MGRRDPLDGVRAAAADVERAQQRLRDAVGAARAAGRTWAELGQVLGTTRQAAFKRFGSIRDPRTGAEMEAVDTHRLVGTTERVFALVDAGDHDGLAALMTAPTAAALTREVVLDTWAAVVGATGNLARCVATEIELPDGTSVAEGDRVVGDVVARTTVECEAGEWLGRVAYDGDGRVTGLLVVPPGTTDLPW